VAVERVSLSRGVPTTGAGFGGTTADGGGSGQRHDAGGGGPRRPTAFARRRGARPWVPALEPLSS
jgi:hypothetical protein